LTRHPGLVELHIVTPILGVARALSLLARRVVSITQRWRGAAKEKLVLEIIALGVCLIVLMAGYTPLFTVFAIPSSSIIIKSLSIFVALIMTLASVGGFLVIFAKARDTQNAIAQAQLSALTSENAAARESLNTLRASVGLPPK
jgi:hypothetical protein